jgi:hypothetical protein
MLGRGMSIDDVAVMTGMDRNTLVGLQEQMRTSQKG